MLEDIRKAIEDLPETEFSEFYQEYVIAMQDSIINHQLADMQHQFSTVEDIPELIKGINKLSEDLQ